MSKKKEECYASYGLCHCSECRPTAPYPGPWLERAKSPNGQYARSVWVAAQQASTSTGIHGLLTEACLAGCCCMKCRPVEVWLPSKLASTHHGVATEICLRGCCCAQCRPALAAQQAMDHEKFYDARTRIRFDKSVALAAGMTLIGVFLTASNPAHTGVLLLVFCWLLLHVFEVERYQP